MLHPVEGDTDQTILPSSQVPLKTELLLLLLFKVNKLLMQMVSFGAIVKEAFGFSET